MTLILHKGAGVFNLQNGGKTLIQARCWFLCLDRRGYDLCTHNLEEDSAVLGKLASKSGSANTVCGFTVLCPSLLAFIWWLGICKAVAMRLLIMLGRECSPELS